MKTQYNRLYDKDIYNLVSYKIDCFPSDLIYATLRNKITKKQYTIKGVKAERLVDHHLFVY